MHFIWSPALSGFDKLLCILHTVWTRDCILYGGKNDFSVSLHSILLIKDAIFCQNTWGTQRIFPTVIVPLSANWWQRFRSCSLQLILFTDFSLPLHRIFFTEPDRMTHFVTVYWGCRYWKFLWWKNGYNIPVYPVVGFNLELSQIDYSN